MKRQQHIEEFFSGAQPKRTRVDSPEPPRPANVEPPAMLASPEFAHELVNEMAGVLSGGIATGLALGKFGVMNFFSV